MATGKLANIGQHDWIAVSLVANQAYEMTITGLSQDGSVTIGTAAGLAEDGTEAEAISISDIGLVGGSTSDLYFMPAASGTYYLDVSDSFALSTSESYTISAATTTADFTDNPTAPGHIAVGGTTNGQLTNVGQHDWIAVSLVANQAYEMTITGLSQDGSVTIGTAAGLAEDGTEAEAISESDIGLVSGSAHDLYFMPAASGTYYLDVSDSFALSTSENYAISVATTTADFTDNPSAPGHVAVGGTANGELTNVGQHDWIAVSLVANQAYEMTITGLSQDGSVTIGTAAGLAEDGTEAEAIATSDIGLVSGSAHDLYFMPAASGTYYLDVSDSFALSTSENYAVSVATTTADFTDNPTAPGHVAVGGTANGELTNVGQHDWIAVSLVANQAYEMTITGLSQDGSVTIGTAAGLAEDGTEAEAISTSDIGLVSGSAHDLYFMPSASGTYYLDVSDSFALSTSESYAVSVATTTADFTDNPTAPGHVAVGGQVSGQLTNIGQHDWIAVSLVANQAYEMTITGLSQDGSVTIGTAAGLAEDGTEAEAIATSDIGLVSGSAHDLYFMPAASGTYYLDVSDSFALSTSESYTISVATTTADFTDNPTAPGHITVGGAVTPPPVITGSLAGQAITDQGTIAPFSKVTITDPNSGQTESVTVTLSSPANGTLSNLAGGGFNAATGIYTITGSPAAVTTALDGLVFTPTLHQVSPGQSVTTTFTINDTDTAAASATNNTTTVVATASGGVPVISGTVAGQKTSDAATVTPFSKVTITDPNAGQNEIVTVTLSAAANGTLGNLGGGGFNAATGVYTVAGSATAVTAALDGLVFTPTAHQVAAGQSVTTTFTIKDTDTAAVSDTDSTTTVIATASAAVLSITGTTAGQQTSDTATVSPFSRVTIADPNSGQTETVTVTLFSAANGTLSNLDGGAFNAATGVYTDTGSASAVTAALDGLVFTPTAHQVAVGQSVTTTFTIKDTDTAAVSATNSTTTVIATAGAAVLSITGTTAGQQTSDTATVSPFSRVTITDPNSGQTETVTVTLSSAANGTLSNLGGGAFNAATGVYTDTGSASAVTTALDGLVFTPTAHQVAVGQSVTTTFTIKDTDTAAVSATNSTTTVVTTASGGVPVISGAVAGQAVVDQATVAPLSQVTITDPNAGQTETVTVALSAAANGTLTNLGGGSYNATTGVYTDIGSAAAVTAALDGLTFNPTLDQVAQGQTVTTTFTIRDTDTAGASATNTTASVVAVSSGGGGKTVPLVTASEPTGGSYVNSGTIADGASTIAWTGTASATVATPANSWTAYSGDMAEEILAVSGGNTGAIANTNFVNPALTALKAPFDTVGLGIWGDPSNNAADGAATESIGYAFSTPLPGGTSFLLWDPGAGGTNGPMTFTFSASLRGVPVSVAGWSFAIQGPFGTTPLSSISIDQAAGLVTVNTYAGTNFPDSVIVATPNTAIDNVKVSASTIPFDFWGLAFPETIAAAGSPMIGGTAAGQTTTDVAAISPFSRVTIADPNSGQTETVTVTLSAAADGTLGNLAGGAFNAATGVYSDTGSAAAVTAALDGLLFTPTAHQVAPGQSVTTRFTITDTDTAGTSATDSATTVVATASPVTSSAAAIAAAYQAILGVAPPGGVSGALVTSLAAQIGADELTLSAFAASLIGMEQTLYTTIAALVTIDAFYDATPSGALLATAGSGTSGTSYVTAAELHNLGYSDTNVWTVMASGWGADPTSRFFAQYDSDATGTTAGYTAFIDAVYAREFGFTPSTANLQNLLADIPGTQALLNGGGHIAAPIQVMAGLYGYLLEVGQTVGIGQYASATTAFLLAAANGTVTYGPELTTEFPSGTGMVVTSNTVTGSAKVAGAADPNVITVTGSDQLIDPGTGSHAIQFLAGTSGDTLVPHVGGIDDVSGFDPGTDVLDVRSLLTGTGLALTGDVAALSNYLTVVDQGPDALLRFDPIGQGGGGTVAVLRGLGGTVTGLGTLIAHDAIRIA